MELASAKCAGVAGYCRGRRGYFSCAMILKIKVIFYEKNSGIFECLEFVI
jgi:hypothetical protein